MQYRKMGNTCGKCARFLFRKKYIERCRQVHAERHGQIAKVNFGICAKLDIMSKNIGENWRIGTIIKGFCTVCTLHKRAYLKNLRPLQCKKFSGIGTIIKGFCTVCTLHKRAYLKNLRPLQCKKFSAMMGAQDPNGICNLAKLRKICKFCTVCTLHKRAYLKNLRPLQCKKFSAMMGAQDPNGICNLAKLRKICKHVPKSG